MTNIEYYCADSEVNFKANFSVCLSRRVENSKKNVCPLQTGLRCKLTLSSESKLKNIWKKSCSDTQQLRGNLA